jgi:hypothetical protein
MGNIINGNIFNKHNDQEKKTLVKRIFFSCMEFIQFKSRSCNKVGHLFWVTILVQHETNDVILYIHSVHKHRGNSFQRQNYKMRLKQRSLNWINSMQEKKILFTNVFFSWSLCLLNMFPSMFDVEKNSLCVYVRYEYTEWRHWSRAAREL